LSNFFRLVFRCFLVCVGVGGLPVEALFAVTWYVSDVFSGYGFEPQHLHHYGLIAALQVFVGFLQKPYVV
jgi:hypothetical protein